MTETMRVIEVREPGGPEMLVVGFRPRPIPGRDEVLLRVIAAGVNRPDVMQRRGLYPPPPGASDILGLELAGEVVAIGPDVHAPSVGDRVCALVTGGAYADYCVAAAPLCLPIPVSVSMVEAAGLPETFFTVWTNVFERGELQAKQTLLVHGGASGIGVAAIQLARAFGAVVHATAGSDEKCRRIEELGASAINYRTEDFVAEIRERTSGRGVDVILDIIGGDYLARNLECLAERGRLVQIAVQGGAKAEINLLRLMLKRQTVTGSTLRARSVAEKSRIAEALMRRVWPLFADRTIRPIVHAIYPLDRAADAHRALERGEHVGKLILDVDAE